MKRVLEFHKEGYNCAEAILKAFNEDTGLDIPIAIASPFGTGMTVGSTCGAVTGTLMAVGALKGRNTNEEKNNSRALTREIITKVKEKYGTIECIELKKKGVTCDEIIEYSYSILSEYIKQNCKSEKIILYKILGGNKMKIAIAINGKEVSGHFGHCEGYVVYFVEKDAVLKQEFLPYPGHKPGFLPAFLKEQGVNIIIAGGMGETAQDLFKENQIEVVVGVQGNCEEVLQRFIKGELKSTGSVCTEHSHEGNCNDQYMVAIQ
eukprot:TRINITY_DN4493_c0_g1_i8.p5 TRINITY_DN4493_c0_g1~~TRINITY_DN4493_c0_g1_i8.p5  ORF type:complete len:263 (+),score=54.28 TRINITY_DN4493_c0_g1_i8:734-1522(+)